MNALYRYARHGNATRVYRSARAVQWRDDALLLLLAAGRRTLPAGEWWVSLTCIVHTCRLDVDAPLKIVIDTAVIDALGIDDRSVGHLEVFKVPVRRRADERLKLRLRVEEANMTHWESVGYREH